MSDAVYCVVRCRDGKVVGSSAHNFSNALVDAQCEIEESIYRRMMFDLIEQKTETEGYLLEQRPLAAPVVDAAIAHALRDAQTEVHNALHDAIYEVEECQRIQAVAHDAIESVMPAALGPGRT